MKKRIAKICVSILILLLAVTAVRYGNATLKNKDDIISKTISEAVGRKKVYYKDQVDIGRADMYSYVVLDYEDETLLKDIVEAVNAVIKEKGITDEICLDIQEKKLGGTESAARIYNYYSSEQYKTLQRLEIYGTKHSYKGDNSPYNKASAYINLPDIKKLLVTEEIAQNAEEEGIDWYEVWPDLEYYEILDYSGN
ncbi:MAG: hypothetical protein K2K46_08435 [Lachnospiraceae bacterium]|nr:hypothetical protein [Lachnospiraceae bacterium]